MASSVESMEVAEYVAQLVDDGRLLASAASVAGLDALVPSCPDWQVRDLVRHIGGVHRWATTYVRECRVEPIDDDLEAVVGGWPADRELGAWFEQGVDELAATLLAADPNLKCFTFLACTSPLMHWARRQAHETAMHRVDAQTATGPVTPFPALFAADGVDELLTCFVARPGSRLRADHPCSLLVECSDVDFAWTLHLGPDVPRATRLRGDASCRVQGAADSLYRALWNRPAPALHVEGDTNVCDLFLDRVHVRWG